MRLAVFFLPVLLCAQSVSIRMEDGTFRVHGAPRDLAEPAAGWASLFSVHAGEGEVPPVLGAYNVSDGVLSFKPRFPIGAGIRVRAVYHGQVPPVVAEFRIPKAEAIRTTRVVQVYPSVDVLPANQLKFYLQFSAPMSRGEAWQRIHLLDSAGKRVELPFLEIEQELWDPDYKRLTVLFDPGRIKRGLYSLAEAGPAIEEGKQYTLVIDPEWQDGNGAPLQSGFRKTFRVGPEDRDPPDPAKWTVKTPAPGSKDPLTIEFPEPMEIALLERLISIHADSREIDGAITIEAGERQWRFVPAEPWAARDYRIVIDTALEDLAGNRIGRPFDVDTFERITRRVEKRTVSLPFRPGLKQRKSRPSGG